MKGGGGDFLDGLTTKLETKKCGSFELFKNLFKSSKFAKLLLELATILWSLSFKKLADKEKKSSKYYYNPTIR